MKTINLKSVYVSKKTGKEAQIKSILHESFAGVEVEYYYTTDPTNKYSMNAERFFERFEEVSLKEAYSTQNINQDIINLIESGYEFKSFWGTTLNGRELHVDMES